MSFTRFKNKKTIFYAIRTNSSKSRKIGIFSKGLTHGFGLQMAVFPTFIFQAIQGRKISFTIFYIEKTPLQPMKTKSSKSRKTDVFPKGLTHSFGQKIRHFSNFFFQARQARKMSFTRLQNEKTPFQAIKTRGLKSRKVDICLKGLTHGFGLQMAVFQLLFFRQYRPGKCLLRYSTSKKRRCSL